jgi:RNA polymerase sigma-70 factor (ECF subfamily)
MDAYFYRWNRKRQFMQRFEDAWELGEEPVCSPLQWLTDDLSAVEGRRIDVRAALGRLPASWQRVVVEALIEERPLAEIAERMGRSTGAIKQMLYRARRQLRRELAAYEEVYGGKSRDDSV